MGATDQWRWTDDRGVQRLLGIGELRAALASGRLKSSVLVWRRGMQGWVRAREVPELMAGLDEGPSVRDTVTLEQPRTLGARAEPTPSIPPLDHANSRIDIGVRGAPRGLAHTMTGIGDHREPKPDGGWKSGAARRDDEEETVTKLRLEDEPSTLAGSSDQSVSSPRSATKPWGLEQAKHQAQAERSAGPQPSTRSPYKSVPTIRPQPSDPPEKGSRPPPPPRRPSIPPPPKRSVPPPPVESTAVLSEAVPSKLGSPRVPRTDALDDGWVLEETKGAPSETQERAGTHGLMDDDEELVTRAKAPAAEGPPAPQRPRVPSKARPRKAPPAKGPADAQPRPLPRRSPATRPELKGPNNSKSSDRGARAAFEAKPQPSVQPEAAARVAPSAPEPPQLPSAEPHASTHSFDPTDGVNPTDGARAPDLLPPPPAEEISSEIPGTRLAVTGLQAGISTEMPPPRRGIIAGLEPPLILAGVGAAVVLVLLAFFLGRATAPAQAGLASAVQAKSGMAVVPFFARAKSSEANQRPCLMLRAPAMFASAASQRVPFETATKGERLFVGYARSAYLPRGMLVDPAVGSAETLLEVDRELEEPISRVVPLVGEGIEWGTTLRAQNGMTEAVWVNAPEPFVLGFEGKSFVKRATPEGESTTLWQLGDGSPNAMRALHVPGKGTIIAYRVDKNAIYYAALKADGTVWHEPTALTADEGIVGKPDLASNGTRVTVAFAFKAADGAPELRWTHGALGQPLEVATPVDLPPGGPGGGAIAPAVASLPGNRWLLMWTEGSRVLRAQTYDGGFEPIGQALRVSPATGRFGQGTVTAVGGRAVVVFLLATAQGFEVWGTVLQCR